jgi:hypothetical protein
MTYMKQLQSDVTNLSLHINKYTQEDIQHQFSGMEFRLNYGDTSIEYQLNYHLGFQEPWCF